MAPGSLVRMAVKGSITTELFIDFIHHLARYKTESCILLMFNRLWSHLNYTIAEVADEHDISLLCLPSNMTHELQPLDKSVIINLLNPMRTSNCWCIEIHILRDILTNRILMLFKQKFGPCATYLTNSK